MVVVCGGVCVEEGRGREGVCGVVWCVVCGVWCGVVWLGRGERVVVVCGVWWWWGRWWWCGRDTNDDVFFHTAADMHRIGVAGLLGVRLPATPPPPIPRRRRTLRHRGLKNGHSRPCGRSAKKCRKMLQKPDSVPQPRSSGRIDESTFTRKMWNSSKRDERLQDASPLSCRNGEIRPNRD